MDLVSRQVFKLLIFLTRYAKMIDSGNSLHKQECAIKCEKQIKAIRISYSNTRNSIVETLVL